MTLLAELTRLHRGSRTAIRSAVGRYGLLALEQDFPAVPRVVWFGDGEIPFVRLRTGGELEEEAAVALATASGLRKWLWLKEEGDFLVYCEAPEDRERAVELFREVVQRVPGARFLQGQGREESVNPLDYELLAAEAGEDGEETEALVLFLAPTTPEWAALKERRERFRQGLQRLILLWETKTGRPATEETRLDLQHYMRRLEVAGVLDAEPRGESLGMHDFSSPGQPSLVATVYRVDGPEGPERVLWAGLRDG